jgi:polysaccharide export outer membrane protein
MEKKYASISILFLTCLCLFSSCRSLKTLTYFQKDTNQPDTLSVAKAYNSTIQPGDLLSVYVGSLSDEASRFFNPYPATSTAGGGAASALSSSEANGFLVDQAGNIELPIIGSFKIAGLTTLEAKSMLTKKLESYLKEPRVMVRVINYKISLMGEVSKPSVYVIPNEKITITEAISLAGDLTNFARRDNILIIRDNNGKKEFGTVNLNDRSVFSSPYYYLRANDMVYVEPVGAKSLQTNTLLRILPIVLSITSFVILIIMRLF